MENSDLEETGSMEPKEEVISYYPAKVIAVPSVWNTFCYIVECNELPHSPYYFSEAALGKPANKNVNDTGFLFLKKIIGKSYLHMWSDKDSHVP